MLSKRSFLSVGAGAAAAALGAGRLPPAWSQPSAPIAYPLHPVRWVVPYASGGATDVLSRLICQRLSERLGNAFVVENKPGAGSNIGTEAVINSQPDGYTLLLTSTANAINASFDKTIQFDFAKAIVPVAGVARIPLVMVINNDLPVHSVADFIAYANAHPTTLNAASSGVGTSLHLSGELFKALTGVKFVHVPYRGSAPALSDLMAGQVQVMFDNVTSSAELIRSGKIRALGVTTKERSDILPDVPPIGDTVPGYETSSFYGVGAPKGASPEIVALLNREINAALNDDNIKAQFGMLGAIPLTGNSTEFAAMLAAETTRWGRIVEMSTSQTH